MYTAKEAAKALGVQPQTVRRYTKRSDYPLKAEYIGIRRDLRIREDVLIQFAQHHGMTVHLPQNSQN